MMAVEGVREALLRINDEADALRVRLADVERALEYQRALTAAERSRADSLSEQIRVAWRVTFGRSAPAGQP